MDDALFGAIAVQEGFLSQAQLDACLLKRDGGSVPDALLKRGLLTPAQVEAVRDILRIHLAEASAPEENGSIFQQDRFMLHCPGCETYYLVQGLAEGTQFVCRKCKTALTVRPAPPAPAPTPAAPEGGRRIGPYEVLGEIGRGAMSVVYKAVDGQTKQVLALKVLRESDVPNPSQLKRFQQESRAASRLSHPNIVAVHGAGEVSGTYYIAMDYVEGVTLDVAVAGGKLGLRDFVVLLEKVARALHHAHEYGIVHRDLKPGNILVDARGEPRVTDFGLAKMDHLEKGATHPGATLGTPFYMSPEQVEGDILGTDRRSDIYGMGVMLYQALTGRVPYPGASFVEVYRSILSGSIIPPGRINSKSPPELEAICLKALERDKRRRYATARDFADDLRRHLDGVPVLALEKPKIPNPKPQ